MNESTSDIRRQNRIRIMKYIIEKKCTSRQQIAQALGYSKPTVFQNVKELLEWGILCERGEFGSTGGRRAKMLAVNPDFGCVAGLEIRFTDIRCVLMDLGGEQIAFEMTPFLYEHTPDYYGRLGEHVKAFIEKARGNRSVVGVGISLPGVVNQTKGILEISYGLQIANVSLQNFVQNIPYDICFERDATSAARSEIQERTQDMIYLFLDSTVGGAIYLNGQFFHGDCCKAGGFGHSVIVAGGRRCTCGKRGCLSAYCAVDCLLEGKNDSLEAFFARLAAKDATSMHVWEEYVDKLAIGITNIRGDFDCRVVLGGAISEFLPGYLSQLESKMQKYNTFDFDTAYLSLGRYHKEAASIGAAKKMRDKYIDNLDIDKL